MRRVLPGLILWLGCQALSAQLLAQPLIAHPEPERPLAAKWDWALQQPATTVNESRWIAYQFSTVLDEKINPYLHTTRNSWSSWWQRNPLDSNWRLVGRSALHNMHPQRLTTAALLAGNTRRQQELLQQLDLVLLARVEGELLTELRIVEAHTPVDWHNIPVYWLGPVTADESLRLLTAELDPAQDDLLNSALLWAIGLHAVPDRAAVLLALYNTDEWIPLRPAIIDSLSLQKSVDIELLLLDVATDQNAALAERHIAIAALHQFDSAAAQAALIDLAAALNPRAVRATAIRALAYFDAAAVLDTLSAIARTDADAEIVESAIESLAQLRTNAAHSVLLEIAREHPREFAREEALQQLQRELL